MAPKTNFYSLFKLKSNTISKYIIVKAVRPEFSNADQGHENWAIDVHDNKRNKIAEKISKTNGFNESVFVAECSDFPLGDIFYESESNIEIDVWIAFHKDLPFFAFGISDSEDNFWSYLQEEHNSGDCYIFPDLKKPAAKQSIIFLQEK
ncbi:MAG: hypothetical protein GY760_08015 [Deltaproteobacteria bacterium]|nr:hypothetical protein [Deltaproteobacteria bacterium]